MSQNNILSGFGANVDDLDGLVDSFKDGNAAGASNGSKRKAGGVGIGGRGNFADSDDDDNGQPVQQKPRGKSKVRAATSAAGSEDAMTRAARLFGQANKKRNKSKK